jgi:hypothetical protein
MELRVLEWVLHAKFPPVDFSVRLFIFYFLVLPVVFIFSRQHKIQACAQEVSALEVTVVSTICKRVRKHFNPVTSKSPVPNILKFT